MEALAPQSGEHIVDIGSGPGLMAAELADAVSERGKVCGVDSSPDMITLSSARSAIRPWLDFHVADATRLPYDSISFSRVQAPSL